MKRFEDMTPDELFALNTDDAALALCVDYECAVEGVPLLPPEPTAPESPKSGPDLRVWRVQLNVLLKDQDEAQALCDGIDAYRNLFCEQVSLGARYDYGAPETFKTRDQEDGAVALPVQVKLWSQAHYDEHKGEQSRHKIEKATYDEARRLFDKAAEQRRDVEKHVRGAVQDVVDERFHQEQARTEFDRYVVLADGDREMALKFFLKATNNNEEWARRTVGLPTPSKVGASE